MKRVHVATLLILIAVPAVGLFIVLQDSSRSAPPPSTSGKGVSIQSSTSIQESDGDSIELVPHSKSSSRADVPDSHSISPVFLDADPSLITGTELNEILTARPYAKFRVVKVNSDYLREQIRSVDADIFISIDLVDGPITVIPESGEEVADGWRTGFATMRGKIEGADLSKVSIGISPGGFVTGYFQSNEIGYVTIEPIGDGGEHLLWTMRDDVEKVID